MATEPIRDDAALSLDDITRARTAMAARVSAPWWYHLGTALCTASLFVGIGLFPAAADGSSSSAVALVVAGAIVGPTMLTTSLKRVTGVSVDRYADGMLRWYLVVFGVLAVGLLVQLWLDVPYALFAGAAVGFVATLLLERHIDRLLARRVGAAGGAR